VARRDERDASAAFAFPDGIFDKGTFRHKEKTPTEPAPPGVKSAQFAGCSPIHPGEMLADELQELGISAAELARTLHVPANRISQILKGRRAITAAALRLGQWLGTGPEFWKAPTSAKSHSKNH
jgi:addiction module HigA family antidote